MTKKEFLEKINSYGIQLYTISIYIDKEVGIPFSLGAYNNNNDWIVYSVNERSEVFEVFHGNEGQAFEKLFRFMFVRLDELNYVTNSITKEVIKTDKQTVIELLRNEYNMEQPKLEETWQCLLKDFHILNEVKYYVLNRKHVKDSECYKVMGYSAETLIKLKCLNVIDAFRYMIYIKENQIIN